MDDLISVIVSTYNRADALDAVLRALSRQSDRHFEIVVADDGSGAATQRVVRDRSAGAVAVKHVWHEDRGFRLAEIRNLGIRASAGRYVVFLDGDCIARHDFVAAHRRLAEPGWFVTGNRILMSRGLTERVLQNGLEPELWGFGAHLSHRARGDLNRLHAVVRAAARPACARRRRADGRAPAAATWRSGATTSMRWTGSTPPSRAGAGRIPISSSA